MNDNDCIRKAVELADGFNLDRDDGGDYIGMLFAPFSLYLNEVNESDQWMLDALAAQLVRQMDAVHHFTVVTFIEETVIEDWTKNEAPIIVTTVRGNNRTMHTIKAIVDSEVLK